MRRERNLTDEIPYFDPADGGDAANCLFLLEAPGPKAVSSGFISRNNPDETAKNFFLLNEDANLPRYLTVTWNVIPWYIGDGSKIRPATMADIHEARPYLKELLSLLPRLLVVVLIGRKAQRAGSTVQELAAGTTILNMLHPSPLVVNRDPWNRPKMLKTLVAAERLLLKEDN
jgi:uracil-DNA glycosylase